MTTHNTDHIPHGMIDEHRVAEILGCTVAKVRADRNKGTGCPYYKIGRMVRYDPTDVQEWLASKRMASTTRRA